MLVSGSNDPNVQLVVNAINNKLGNYGSTIDPTTPVNYREGDEKAFGQFINELKAGQISAVIFYGCNPVYNSKYGSDLSELLKKVDLTISTTDRPDETAKHVEYVAPDNHFLESWGDANPAAGHYSLMQPAITNIFDTRQAQASFMTWAGVTDFDYFDYLKAGWESALSEIGDRKTHV